MIKFLIMFSVTFFLTGCIGIGPVYSDKSNLDCKDLNLTVSNYNINL